MKIKDCNLAIKPRIYQKHAYDLMKKNYKEKNDRTFHIVAPPGSGKTILGLSLLLMLKERTFILSPNRTIASQWTSKFKDFAVNTLDDTYDCSQLISSNIEDNPEILSTTYQAFSVKNKDGELHENAEFLIEYLISNNFKTIVLDECHHLLNYWAEIIKKFIKKAPYEVVIIGLTATPPRDKSNKEKQVYLDIMGEVDYQVPIPAVVKDGNLAPFRDLPYFVTPTDSELSFLNKETNGIYTLISEINKLSKSGELDYNLSEYFEILIKEPLYENEPISFNEYYLKDPDLAIAIVKYLLLQDLTLPIEVIIQDEMLEDISIYDYATLFRAYLYDFLVGANLVFALQDNILKTWKKLGYNLHKNKVTEIKNNISNVLQVSNAKIKAVETILTNEFEIIRNELKALVLTDFIEAHNKKRLNEIVNPSLGGASGVFIHISNTKLFDILHPIMITGKKVMIHKELEKYFIDKFKNISFIEKDKYLLLENPNNTTELLGLVTELTYKNKSKLLIGTRSLLGEGYDNVKINTLIDLTVTSSFISVNQIRGRALRKDPDVSDKVANIWEVITVIPDIETGYYDLKRVVKKHNQFLSLSPKGRIERGIAHLGLEQEKLAHIETINQKSLSIAQKRGNTLVDWKIGEKYKDNFVKAIEFKVPNAIKKPRTLSEKNENLLINKKFYTKRKNTNTPILILWLLMLITLIYPFKSFLRTINRNKANKNNFLKMIVKILFESFKELKLIEKNEEIENLIEFTKNEGTTSILVKNEEISEAFTTSVHDVFQPVFYQKYVVEYKNKYNKKNKSYFPIPSYFAKNKTLANIYLKYWNQYISEGELIYIKNKDNYNKIKQYLSKKTINISGKSRDLWM